MDMARSTALIPESALKKHIAILGTNGSGKTSVAKSQVVEPALAAGERVCCIDPTGVMWGVRLGADGKPKGGYPVYIVGGEHADFPLTKRDGDAWAEIVGTSSDSFIFDTSLMTVSDRTAWFTDFAQTLIRKNKGPLRVIEDEAHLFAPQGGATSGGQAPAMLHAANNLLALGRSKGLRVTMISQRPAKLHKDSLSQAHTLIAMKLIAPQDRKAINEWVSDQTDPENGKELIASLPTLVPGEGWVWAPAEGILDRVKFPRPRTYDSSQAPEDGEGEGPQLTKIDPATISGRLATVAAEADANDPAKLKRRIAELERAKPVPTLTVDPLAIEAAEKRGFDRGFVAGAEEQSRADTRKVAAFAKDFGDNAAAPLVNLAPVHRPSVAKVAPESTPRQQPVARSMPSAEFTGAQMKVLRSLSMWKALGKETPSKPMVAMCAGYSHSSGNFGNMLSQLKTAGAIEYPSPGLIRLLTDTAAVGSDEGAALLRGRLSGPQIKVVDALRAGELSKAELGDAAGYSATSGNFGNLLSQLRTLGIIDYPATGRVALEPWVFDVL